MNYTFPIIETIDDVLPHIKNYEEIVVSENVQGNYVTIRYMISTPNLWEWNENDALGCAIRRECRGIAFDVKTGEVISRPWHKFFNVNEKPETQFNLINLEEPHIILEKLDGCCEENTILLTQNGEMTIKDICDQKYRGLVLGYNHIFNQVYWTPVVGHSVKDNNNDEWYEIETQDGKVVKLTSNHKVWCVNKKSYIKVSDLTEDDEFLIQSFPCYDIFINILKFNQMKIKSVKKIKSSSKLYDIQTTTNNFFANEILVHNSMIRPIKCPDGDFYIATKAGESEVSAQASNWLKDHSNYYDFMNDIIDNHKCTPIFEWVSRQNRIVIDYPEDNLILTGIRVNKTGEYYNYNNLIYYGSLYGIDIVDVVHETGESIGQLVDTVKAWVDSEGIVIRFNSGHILKIKADDYILRHHAKESINHEKNLIGLILADGLDDLLPVLHENNQKRVSDFEKAFHAAIHDTAMNIHDMYREYVRNYALSDKKDFAVNFALKKDKKYQQFLFGLHRGDYNLLGALYSAIENSISSSSRVENVRWIFQYLKY